MSGYDKKDAARDTGATVKEVSETWHYARNQCQDDQNGKTKADKTDDWKRR